MMLIMMCETVAYATKKSNNHFYLFECVDMQYSWQDDLLAAHANFQFYINIFTMSYDKPESFES